MFLHGAKYPYKFSKVLTRRKRQELLYDFKHLIPKNDTRGNHHRQIQAIKNTNTSKACTFLILSPIKRRLTKRKKMSLCNYVAGRDPSVERLSGGLARRPRGESDEQKAGRSNQLTARGPAISPPPAIQRHVFHLIGGV